MEPVPFTAQRRQYHEARDAYLQASDDVSNLSIAVAVTRQQVEAFTRMLRSFDIQQHLNGLDFGDHPARNESERDMALVIAREASSEAQRLQADRAGREGDLLNLSTRLEAARDRRTVAKRDMDFVLALVNGGDH